jgi:hypothetical protein
MYTCGGMYELAQGCTLSRDTEVCEGKPSGKEILKERITATNKWLYSVNAVLCNSWVVLDE